MVLVRLMLLLGKLLEVCMLTLVVDEHEMSLTFFFAISVSCSDGEGWDTDNLILLLIEGLGVNFRGLYAISGSGSARKLFVSFFLVLSSSGDSVDDCKTDFLRLFLVETLNGFGVVTFLPFSLIFGGL